MPAPTYHSGLVSEDQPQRRDGLAGDTAYHSGLVSEDQPQRRGLCHPSIGIIAVW